MPDQVQYKRVLVKLSGESLCACGSWGVDRAAVDAVVSEVKAVADMGVQIGLVVGGGNLIRGRDLSGSPHIARTTADSMGMLATVMNALALRDALQSASLEACVLSATEMDAFCGRFTQKRAVDELEAGRIVLMAGGTGNPFFTTDTCAALRALEIRAEALLKATKVDGVFDSDPAENPDAKRYEHLTYEKVLADRLGVMDLTAVSMCMEHKLPIIVFQLSKSGSLAAAVNGQSVGTMITE